MKSNTKLIQVFLKIKMKKQNAFFVTTTGVEALYRGLVPVLTSICASNFVYFYTFNGMKASGDACGLKASSVRDLLFGYVSGCVNAMVTTPLWVANTRLKLQTKKVRVFREKEAGWWQLTYI